MEGLCVKIKPCGVSIREILYEAHLMDGALMNFLSWLFSWVFRSWRLLLFILRYNLFITLVGQPVAKVLAYLHVQVSPISCWVVGSILALIGKTLTQQLSATGGRGWWDTTLCTVNWYKKSPVWSAWLASSYLWAFRISLLLIKFILLIYIYIYIY